MRLSFEGSFNNIFSKLSNLEDSSSLAEDIDKRNLTIQETDIFKDLLDDSQEILIARLYISIYHDIILGLAKGDCTVQQLKEFMFYNMTENEIKSINYEDAVEFNQPTDKE